MTPNNVKNKGVLDPFILNGGGGGFYNERFTKDYRHNFRDLTIKYCNISLLI